MNMELSTKEKVITKSYIKEMIALFSEKDMLSEGDCIYLPTENIYITKGELILLEKKLNILWD